MKRQFGKFVCLMISVISLTMVSSAKAEIIDLDVSQVDPRFVDAFRQAEAFWDARVLGYSNTLPRAVQAQLTGRVQITAITGDLGGGGVLGFSATTEFRGIATGNIFQQASFAIPTAATIAFDDAFLDSSSEEDIVDVMIHEMGHSVGIGALWVENGLVRRIGGVGPLQYTGINARRAFAIEAGTANRGITGFVPIEQQGSPASALVHWDDDSPVFNSIATDNRIELMTAFFVDNTERFISRISLASLVDMHYVIDGFNEDELLPFAGSITGLVPVQPSNPFLSQRRAVGPSTNPFAARTLSNPTGSRVQPNKRINIYNKRR